MLNFSRLVTMRVGGEGNLLYSCIMSIWRVQDGSTVTVGWRRVSRGKKVEMRGSSFLHSAHYFRIGDVNECFTPMALLGLTYDYSVEL